MRILCFLFLVAFAGAVALFAYQNQQEVSLTLWDQTITASVPLVVAAIFVLGMLCRWTIIGMLRRSVDQVMEPQDRR
jgi:lysylphosphatidylglycerol synthetase-like protein (DUF2156 family)